MKIFKLYWLNGKTERVVGMRITDALHRAGYDESDLKRMSHYEEISDL